MGFILTQLMLFPLYWYVSTITQVILFPLYVWHIKSSLVIHER